MAILITNTFKWKRGGRVVGAGRAYLTGTSIDELHKFAESIGVKVGRFVNQSNFPHYQIIANEIGAARVRGAKTIGMTEMSELLVQHFDEYNRELLTPEQSRRLLWEKIRS